MLFQVEKALVFDTEERVIMVGRQVPINGLWMVDMLDLETEEGFEDDDILDLMCNMMEVE